jgi:hypothetical protein
MTPEAQAKAMLAGHGPTLEKIVDHWRLTLGGDPASNKGIYSAVGSNPVKLAEDALAWLNKRTRIAHPKPSVSGEEMRGAPPVPYPEPEAPTVIEKTVEVEKIVENPETQERLAEALRKLDEAEAALESRKAGASVPPPEIADLIRLNESYERANERLIQGYKDAMQRAEIARTQDGTFEGKSTTEWLRKAERYDSAIQWNKGRSAETI